jgi:hypothetical protein
MTDEEFLRAFEECQLPGGQWTHAAHVRLAWLYLRQGGYAETLPRIRAGIRRYNASQNKPVAYHETITQAFLRLIHARLSDNGHAATFAAFCAHNPDLLERGHPLLFRYYRRETLLSDSARAGFVEPDLEALPEPSA